MKRKTNKSRKKLTTNFIKSNNSKLHLIDLFVSIISILLDVIVFNLLGNTLTEYKLWNIAIFIVCFIAFSFMFIWWLTSLFLTQVHYSDGRKIVDQCLYNNSMCCGVSVCESISKNYELNMSKENTEKLNNDFSLYFKSQIIEKEKKFKNDGGRRIWIVSDNLNSEVIDDCVPEYIKENVKNNIKYNFIHIQENNSTVERNREKILSELDRNKNVSFLHLDISNTDLNSYIVYLFGIVIYEYDKYVCEGYFLLRNYSDSQQIEPIYLKMPQCMVDNYVGIFKKTQNKQSSKRETKNNIHIKIKPDLAVEDIEVFLLTQKDCERTKNFIIRSYADIKDKDFFMISDIDTALPSIFSKDGAIIAAINKNNDIVAIQALDGSYEVQKNLSPILYNYFPNAKFAEMGWTVTRLDYQNKGLAKALIKSLEELFMQNETNAILVAAVHPSNFKSLKTYLHLGYSGITFQLHFGVLKIFLVKQKDKTYNLDMKNVLKTSEMEEVKTAFDSGYVLIDIINERDRNIYVFYKSDLNVATV